MAVNNAGKKNEAASVLARLKNQAKLENMTFQMTLQLFAQEEFLRKITRSKYQKNFVLKGGMFIYTLTNFDARPTRDIDFMIQKLACDVEKMRMVMEEICQIDTGNHYIDMCVSGASNIGIDKQYPGVRVSFLGKINNVQIPFSIDVGIDDIIIPNPEKRKIATRLSGFIQPEIYTYSIESTIAEKLDAILQRMDTTSRMKDFFDIYYLSGLFNFEGNLLLKAISATLEHRKRELDADAFTKIIGFESNSFMSKQWNVYEPARKAGIEFVEVLERIHRFLMPIYNAILNSESFSKQWDCEKKVWI